jgi:surface antigen
MISASKRLVFGAGVLLPLLTVAGTASAQWALSPDPGRPRMTREDFDHQRAAAQSLLDKEPPPVGASASWSNPKSGARGRVTMVNARDARGRSPCRRMRYEVSTRGAAGPADMTFTVCRMPDGAWKTAE